MAHTGQKYSQYTVVLSRAPLCPSVLYDIDQVVAGYEALMPPRNFASFKAVCARLRVADFFCKHVESSRGTNKTEIVPADFSDQLFEAIVRRMLDTTRKLTERVGALLLLVTLHEVQPHRPRRSVPILEAQWAKLAKLAAEIRQERDADGFRALHMLYHPVPRLAPRMGSSSVNPDDLALDRKCEFEAARLPAQHGTNILGPAAYAHHLETEVLGHMHASEDSYREALAAAGIREPGAASGGTSRPLTKAPGEAASRTSSGKSPSRAAPELAAAEPVPTTAWQLEATLRGYRRGPEPGRGAAAPPPPVVHAAQVPAAYALVRPKSLRSSSGASGVKAADTEAAGSAATDADVAAAPEAVAEVVAEVEAEVVAEAEAVDMEAAAEAVAADVDAVSGTDAVGMDVEVGPAAGAGAAGPEAAGAEAAVAAGPEAVAGAEATTVVDAGTDTEAATAAGPEAAAAVGTAAAAGPEAAAEAEATMEAVAGTDAEAATAAGPEAAAAAGTAAAAGPEAAACPAAAACPEAAAGPEAAAAADGGLAPSREASDSAVPQARRAEKRKKPWRPPTKQQKRVCETTEVGQERGGGGEESDDDEEEVDESDEEYVEQGADYPEYPYQQRYLQDDEYGGEDEDEDDEDDEEQDTE